MTTDNPDIAQFLEKQEEGFAFHGDWPFFRCLECGMMSVGGEHWRVGEGVLYLACSHLKCRKVYRVAISMIPLGEWDPPEETENECQGTDEEV